MISLHDLACLIINGYFFSILISVKEMVDNAEV